MTPTRFIIMSDCHRGDGSAGDEFAHNSLLYKCALEHYRREGYTYVELGDAEELWEIEDFDQAYITHTSVYDLLRCFHDPDPARTRYIKVWGNHDEYWKDHADRLRGIFPGIRVYEALLLTPPAPAEPMLLLHGHQADNTCSGLGAKVSKFFVRHVWHGLQVFGIGDPTRAAENPGLCNAVDAVLHSWTTGKETPKLSPEHVLHLPLDGTQEAKTGAVPEAPFVVVAGHTHRPVFANLSQTERRLHECGDVGLGSVKKKEPDPRYYNSGSCVHPRCITGLELEFKENGPVFTLVKWSYQVGAEVCDAGGCGTRPLAVTRSVLQT